MIPGSSELSKGYNGTLLLTIELLVKHGAEKNEKD